MTATLTLDDDLAALAYALGNLAEYLTRATPAEVEAVAHWLDPAPPRRYPPHDHRKVKAARRAARRCRARR